MADFDLWLHIEVRHIQDEIDVEEFPAILEETSSEPC